MWTVFQLFLCDFSARHSDVMNPVGTRNVTRILIFLFAPFFVRITEDAEDTEDTEWVLVFQRCFHRICFSLILV